MSEKKLFVDISKIKVGSYIDLSEDSDAFRFLKRNTKLLVAGIDTTHVNVDGYVFRHEYITNVYDTFRIKTVKGNLQGRKFRRLSYTLENSFAFYDTQNHEWKYRRDANSEIQNLSTESLNATDWVEATPIHFIEDVIKEPVSKVEKVIERGKSITVMEIEEFNPHDVEDVHVVGDTIEEKFLSISGSMSKITQGINEKAILDSHKTLVEDFMQVKDKLQALSTPTATKWGWMPKILTNNKLIGKVIDNIEDVHDRNSSTQKSIDYMFGLIYEKYEQFLDMGENLQKSKVKMAKEVQALQELCIESDLEISSYESQAEIPMRTLSLNTRIKTSIEKYKNRLTKVDGAIMATQATINALARDLPSMKSDLTDEMAISSLLNSVGDYQQMYQEIAGLVTSVSESTSEHTYKVVENLLTMQIEDTTAITYLQKSEQATEKFKTMLSDKTHKLQAKINKDANIVNQMVGTAIEYKQKPEAVLVNVGTPEIYEN